MKAIARVFQFFGIIAYFHLIVVAVCIKPNSRYAQFDGLLVARCEARCRNMINLLPMSTKQQSKRSCVKSCLKNDAGEKPGSCPHAGSDISPFAAVCLNACQKDGQCPGVNKCCRHHCGITCQVPEGLSTVAGLPSIPYGVRVRETRCKRHVTVQWHTDSSSIANLSSVAYLIQERHYVGRTFVESRLTDWATCARSWKWSKTFRNWMKPGRWYQFRVAAVNANGSRGFSNSSSVFGVSISPKPPKAPNNMTVSPLTAQNQTLSAQLQWTHPQSDLPIQKYKVFWSRRLHGATALDSVLVHHRIVPKEPTTFLLQELQPNSLYFLQVQAIVQYGNQKIKGEKSGLVLNTTNFTNITDFVNATNSNSTDKVEGLQLHKLFWYQNGLRARVTWSSSKPVVRRYTISWWMGPCSRNQKSYGDLKLAATTKANHFDLYDLQFSCRYRVSVREVTPDGMRTMQDTSIMFLTPSCHEFKKQVKRIKCRLYEH